MSEENKVLEYDEDDSLRFIQNHLPDCREHKIVSKFMRTL
mgnify:CR=1 FL=1